MISKYLRDDFTFHPSKDKSMMLGSWRDMEMTLAVKCRTLICA